MSGKLSFQDLLAEFSDEVFVGRTEQLALFEKGLAASRPPFLILDVSGQGGVGKTTLLEQFRRIASRSNVLTSTVNEDQTSTPLTLAYIAQQFKEAGYPFKSFDERYRTYQVLKEQIEADPKAPTGILDFAVRSATKIGMRSLHKIPLAGDAVDVLLNPDAENVVADHASAFVSYITHRFTNKDDRILLLETNRELSRCFIKDLDEYAQEKRIVLFFDTYEKTSYYLEDWLIDLLSGKFGTFSGNVLFVIAGRYPLSQKWTRFRRAIHQVELDRFTEDEAQDYLIRSGITEEKEIIELISISERLPVLLALLVSTPHSVSMDVSSNAVERFLQGTTQEQRDAALMASIPRFFNLDILNVIIDDNAVKSSFEWLRDAHFVRSTTKGWIYHDVVRSLMLHYLRLQSSKRYFDLHNSLEKYYESCRNLSSSTKLGSKKNEEWLSFETERLYHMLSQNTQSGLIALLTSILSDEELASQQMLSQILMQVSEETNAPHLKIWADQLEHLVVLSNKEWEPEIPRKVLHAGMMVYKIEGIDSFVKARVLEIIGRAHHMLRDYDKALVYYNEAIKEQIERGDIYHWRGHVYIDLKQYSQALDDFSKAIDLDKTNSNHYRCRSMVYRAIEDHSAALHDIATAIELQPRDDTNFHQRGHIYESFKDYRNAISDFTKSIELDPEDDDNYYCRGRVYEKIGDNVKALEDLNRAVELQPEDARNYHWRGHVHQNLANYTDALSDFNSAISLQSDSDYHYNCRGKLRIKMENYQEAFADFNKAIELNPDDDSAYHQLGHLYQAQENYVDALKYFNTSVMLQPNSAENYYCRGMLYWEMGDYVAALSDLSKACEIEPDSGNAYFWRARTYQRMGDHAAAVTDLAKAIELQPEDDDNYYWRGRSHYQMNDYLNALDDFNMAINLQPNDSYNFAWRGRVHLQLGHKADAIADFDSAKELSTDDGLPAYYIASEYAKLGQSNESLVWLRQALELEKDLFQRLLTDANFDNIRNITDFKDLETLYHNTESGNSK